MNNHTKSPRLFVLIQGIGSVDQTINEAYSFTKSAIQDYTIAGVFFYQDAVKIANKSVERDLQTLQKQWSQLANAHHFDLFICVAAATRRGMQTSPTSLVEGFELTGLGTLVDGLSQNEHYRVFSQLEYA